MADLTTDRSDPRLGHGSDEKPVPQQKAYLILSDEERAKGFTRPFRDCYRHKTCGHTTTMSRKIAETYAVNPKFYGSTYCVSCQMHKPVSEFLWLENDGSEINEVGS